MMYLAIVFAAVMIGCFIFALCTENQIVRKIEIFVGVGSAIIGLLLSFFSSMCVVSAGHVGVVETWGKVQPEPLSSGLCFINPFSRVREMSMQTNVWNGHAAQSGLNAHEDSVSVRASNGLTMPVDISVPYRLHPDAAPWVYRNIGDNWVKKILPSALKSAMNRAGSQYTPEELYATKRDEFTDKVSNILVEELKKLLQENYKGQDPPETVVIFNQILVGYIGIPDTVKHAIEAKLKADQEQQAMDFSILKARKEAERKKIEAEGIQKFQEIVTAGISDKLLQWKAIEATLKLADSDNAKIIFIGNSDKGLPVMLSGQDEKTSTPKAKKDNND
jgi:regulator of protease activity HflC (stomatin/prohibitin superfamily)